MRPGSTPTRLLPSPIPFNSRFVTVCWTAAGSTGSTVTANRAFKVLAGGSLRCALCAASTSPVPASATSHDRAESLPGTLGAPDLSRTCVPDLYSPVGREAGGLGASGSAPAGAVETPAPVPATAGLGAKASTPVTQAVEQQTATRQKNPIVIPQT
ncbi:hypothetical protein GCM10010307_30430 [Streptomyces vastus]|uniref:Uncharacterized protein n=1 Tax=Streptomyces vastus TaxID=285451 RepID=A0ABN3QTF2_9ACTN